MRERGPIKPEATNVFLPEGKSMAAVLHRQREAFIASMRQNSLFTADALLAFDRSREPTGRYKLDPADGVMINNAKLMINFLYDFEKSLGLLGELGNYSEAEGFVAKKIAFAKLGIKGFQDREHMTNLYNDYLQISHQINSTQRLLSSLPLPSIASQDFMQHIHQTFNESIKPVVDAISLLTAETPTPTNSTQTKSILETETTSNIATTLQQASDQLNNVTNSIIELKKHIAIGKHKSTYGTGFDAALSSIELLNKSLSKVLKTISLEGLHGTSIVKDIGIALKTFESIDFASIKTATQQDIQDTLSEVLMGLNPLFKQLVIANSLAESRLGLAKTPFDDTLKSLAAEYEKFSEKLGLTVNERYPYTAETLSVKRAELNRLAAKGLETQKIKKELTAATSLFLDTNASVKNLRNMYTRIDSVDSFEKTELLAEITKVTDIKTGMRELSADITSLEALIVQSDAFKAQEFIVQLKQLYQLREELHQKIETNAADDIHYDRNTKAIVSGSLSIPKQDLIKPAVIAMTQKGLSGAVLRIERETSQLSVSAKADEELLIQKQNIHLSADIENAEVIINSFRVEDILNPSFDVTSMQASLANASLKSGNEFLQVISEIQAEHKNQAAQAPTGWISWAAGMINAATGTAPATIHTLSVQESEKLETARSKVSEEISGLRSKELKLPTPPIEVTSPNYATTRTPYQTETDTKLFNRLQEEKKGSITISLEASRDYVLALASQLINAEAMDAKTQAPDEKTNLYTISAADSPLVNTVKNIANVITRADQTYSIVMQELGQHGLINGLRLAVINSATPLAELNREVSFARMQMEQLVKTEANHLDVEALQKLIDTGENALTRLRGIDGLSNLPSLIMDASKELALKTKPVQVGLDEYTKAHNIKNEELVEHIIHKVKTVHNKLIDYANKSSVKAIYKVSTQAIDIYNLMQKLDTQSLDVVKQACRDELAWMFKEVKFATAAMELAENRLSLIPGSITATPKAALDYFEANFTDNLGLDGEYRFSDERIQTYADEIVLVNNESESYRSLLGLIKEVASTDSNEDKLESILKLRTHLKLLPPTLAAPTLDQIDKAIESRTGLEEVKRNISNLVSSVQKDEMSLLEFESSKTSLETVIEINAKYLNQLSGLKENISNLETSDISASLTQSQLTAMYEQMKSLVATGIKDMPSREFKDIQKMSFEDFKQQIRNHPSAIKGLVDWEIKGVQDQFTKNNAELIAIRDSISIKQNSFNTLNNDLSMQQANLMQLETILTSNANDIPSQIAGFCKINDIYFDPTMKIKSLPIDGKTVAAAEDGLARSTNRQQQLEITLQGMIDEKRIYHLSQADSDHTALASVARRIEKESSLPKNFMYKTVINYNAKLSDEMMPNDHTMVLNYMHNAITNLEKKNPSYKSIPLTDHDSLHALAIRTLEVTKRNTNPVGRLFRRTFGAISHEDRLHYLAKHFSKKENHAHFVDKLGAVHEAEFTPIPTTRELIANRSTSNVLLTLTGNDLSNFSRSPSTRPGSAAEVKPNRTSVTENITAPNSAPESTPSSRLRR